MFLLPSLDKWIAIGWSMRAHLRRRWWAYSLAAALYVWCYGHYRLALNMSNSLPHAMYWVVLDTRPVAVGDYVAFEWQSNQFYRRGRIFVKRVAGLPGQTVSVRQGQVFIDGRPVGRAKPYSSRGVPLQPVEPGVIPNGFIYAAAAHPDSLDSRYRQPGLIPSALIVGRAYALF